MVSGWDGRAAVASTLGHKDFLSLIYTLCT